MRSSRSPHPMLLLAAITLIGAVLRYDFATPFNFIIDSDEAIVGLMAKHISEGKEIPVFYYGQDYMGSLEAILAAGSFALFGISNWSLKLVPFLFSLALIPLIYALARRTAGQSAALLAALLIAVPPAPLVVWSSKARGGFMEVIVIGTIAFLTTCTWLRSERGRLTWTVLTGLILGLGWWVNNQVIYFMVPIGLAFLQGCLHQSENNRMRELASHAIVGILAFLVGGLPFWVYNLENDFVTFGMFGGASSRDLMKHVYGLFSTALPIILGGRRFWQEDEFYPGAAGISLLVYGMLFLLALIFTFRAFVAFITLRGVSRERPLELLLVFVLSTMAIFSLSSFGYLVQAPRYLLPIYVGLIPVCAYSLSRLSRPVATGLTAVILAINLSSSYWGEKAVPGEPFVASGERASVDHTQLISWLKEQKYTFVKTNYWIGYRLAFESQEKIKFLVFQEPFQVRIKSYQEEGQLLPENQVPLVLVPSQAGVVRTALETLGIRFQEIMLSGYIVLYDLKSLNKPESLVAVPHSLETAVAMPEGRDASAAIDGSLDTRWASGEHQHPGMTFKIVLSEPTSIREVRLQLGRWRHDFPRKMRILLHKPDGSVEKIVSQSEYEAIQYLRFDEPIELAFESKVVTAVELQQTGEHPIFDWSIAELDLLQ